MVPSDFGENRSAGGLPEPPREKYWATWALVERERGTARAGPRAPSPLVRIVLGERGAAPPFPSPSPPSFPPPSRSRKEGNPTPTRRRIPPPGAPSKGRPASPLAPLYTGAGGHPRTHKLILEIVP